MVCRVLSTNYSSGTIKHCMTQLLQRNPQDIIINSTLIIRNFLHTLSDANLYYILTQGVRHNSLSF